MEPEKWLQIGNATFKKIAQIKGENTTHDQKNNDENVGHRGGEIAHDLASHDIKHSAHQLDSP